MSDSNKDKVKKHSYDGIQEYDNNLPNWWLVTLFLTIFFAFFYWSKYYVFTEEDPQNLEYAAELKKHQENFMVADEDVDEESIIALASNQEVMGQAQEAFKTYCAACHGNHGEGGIGPNLTDDQWIHGYSPKDIVRVINQGVSEKGMTPWKGILANSKIHELAAYVISLEGTNPANAKEPQGEIVKTAEEI